MEALAIQAVIQDFAKNIAEEVAHKRFYQMEEVKAVATTRLSFALSEILRLQTNQLNEEATTLKQILTDPTTPGWRKFEVAGELSQVNNKLKKINKANAAQQDYNE